MQLTQLELELLHVLEWALNDPDVEILGQEWLEAAEALKTKAKGE
ncbi:hypothetical protein [Prosthecobacter vanneervenii]|uniref:Uncharacterized protein n=1 Tax=Prosthecobacter vanneervenii TaxID=48466 RepID=A0A7W8DLA3_9BACT|nr:hypothetical protein [Prosthecobacter vanneervenii]MBB5034113.1 hypothetical protein [Prosthecobacter vanneervenii]